MNYDQPLAAFLRQYFTVKELSGNEKFLIVCSLLAAGDIHKQVTIAQIRQAWSKTSLKQAYHSSVAARAQEHGWVVPAGKGLLCLTESGIGHLLAIQTSTITVTSVPGQSQLTLFTAGQTHSFDKFLRQILSNAKTIVRIADSYVDQTIFDNLLDQIPTTVRVQLMYGKSYETFGQRVARFKTEYPKFNIKNNKHFHDRLLIVDSVGYVLGPSLKDAAHTSPASVVKLNASDSNALVQFFDSIWKKA